MKKIIHICQATVGGTVEYLRLFLENIDANKYENILICPSSGNMKNILEEKVKKVYLLEMEREIKVIKDMKSIIQLRKLLKKEKPDIIYLHSSKAGALGRIAAIGLKSKVIYNPHGWAFTINCSENKKKIYSFIERLLYPLTNIIINISKDEYNQAINYKLSPNKMIVIENGIDIKKFEKKKKDKFLDKFVLGFVGRLVEQKNPLYLITIANELKELIPNCLFYVVGEGELQNELEKQIIHYELEQYFYLRGWSEKVEEDIKNFDVALMISNWEGFGLVVCEYMAAKKLVLSFPVGGVKDIIKDNQNGIFIDRNLKEKVLKVYLEPEFREKIIEAAYKDVKNKYLIDDVIKKHEIYFR